MRFFFIGTVMFSREMLNLLVGNSHSNLVGIATKSVSSFNTDHSDLSDIAITHKIPFKYVKDINAPHIVDWIKSLEPDVICCFGWSSLIKAPLLEVPRIGVIGYHPSQLPQNRGRHPIIWALALGLAHTASSFFLMDETADSGDIISQKIVEITFEDNAYTLYTKLITTAKEQLNEIVYALETSSLNKVGQQHMESNEWRKRSQEDGRIDWRMRSIDIYNLVRALDKPYPGAHFVYKGQNVKVWRCEPFNDDKRNNIEPGKVISVIDNNITVKTCDGHIILTHHELNTKNIDNYLI